MKAGNCPKRGKGDIRRAATRFSPRNHLQLDFWGIPAVEVLNYICVSCGYLESYVRESDLPTVARKCPPTARPLT